MKQPTFGKMARRIVIEIDEKNIQRVKSHDYMTATGVDERGAPIMIHLPAPQLTDTRNLIMSLYSVVGNHLNALMAAMQIGGANAQAKSPVE